MSIDPHIDFSTEVVGFDFETQGSKPEYALQPFRALTDEARPSAVSLVRGDQAVGRLYPTTELLRNALTDIAAKGLYVCGWNVVFDCAWLFALGLDTEANRLKWLDAMLLWRHWCVEPEAEDTPTAQRKSYKLEAAMKEFFPESAGFKDFTNFQTQDAEELKKLLHRNVEDSRFTVKLAEMFWGLLTPIQRQAALIEAQSIPLVARTHVRGITASRTAAEYLQTKLVLDAKEAQEALKKASPGLVIIDSSVKPKQLKLLQAQNPDKLYVNLGSPPQLANLLYNVWQLPITRESRKTAKPSTDKYALYELAFLDPRAKLVKQVREAKNCKTKYADATTKSLDYNGDGCVRPGAKIFSTYSSRMTYSSSQKRKANKDLGISSEEYPTGIALHQWKRGKDFRRLICPPEGYTLVELDFAGQEFGWMAVASGDETMLQLREPGEDAHSYMGAQIAGVDYHKLIQLVEADDPTASLQRKLGKFCIAEGELVLTDRGLVPIEKVSLDMRVWDGLEFVTHTGSVYQGDREVITYAGLTATPDHMVYLEDGSSCFFAEAAATHSRLARTGHGWIPGRFYADQQHRNQARRQGTESPVSLSEVCKNLVGKQGQSKIWEGFAVQGMRNPSEAYQRGAQHYQRRSNGACPEALQCNETKVRESERPVLQKLREAWDSFQLQVSGGSHKLHTKRTTTPNLLRLGYRSAGKQRTLRTGELAACDTHRESQQQTKQQICMLQRNINTPETCLPRTENLASRSEVCRNCCTEPSLKGVKHTTDSESVEPAKLQTKRVYDITNAGPRHRYTVSSYLVFNSNLSFQYRIGSKSATTKARVDYELDIDEYTVKQLLSTYKNTFIGVTGGPRGDGTGYWQKQVQKCRMLRYAETFAGRRVQLNGSWAGREAWQMESSAINYPIQGTGGDQKYLALAVARNLLPKYRGYFYFELHDGLFFIFPHAVARQAAEVFRRVLSNLPYKAAWGVDLPITFPVDAKLSSVSWGDLEKL